jgi:hypothetical protein
VEDFGESADRFCAVIERSGTIPLRRWLIDLERGLAAVYASAAALPDVGPATDRGVQRMSHAEWASLFERLRGYLGDTDLYWMIFDVRHQESLVSASLADDLTDIYRELRSGLDASRSGAAPEDVIFDWRTSFETHWALHAVGALRAIRAAIQELSEAP